MHALFSASVPARPRERGVNLRDYATQEDGRLVVAGIAGAIPRLGSIVPANCRLTPRPQRRRVPTAGT